MDNYSNIIYNALRNAHNVYHFKDELNRTIIQYKINLDNENKEFFEKFHSNNNGLINNSLNMVSLNKDLVTINLNKSIGNNYLEELMQSLKATYQELSYLPLASLMTVNMIPSNNVNVVFLQITY